MDGGAYGPETSAGVPLLLDPYPGPSPPVEPLPPAEPLQLRIPSPIPQRAKRTIDIRSFDHYFRGGHQVKQRRLLDSCLRSKWLLYNQIEPVDGKNSRLLPFLSPRKSGKEDMRCLFDDCPRKFERIDRALGHIRVHLKHQPFPCTGGCGTRDW